MSGGREIERKFLVVDDTWRARAKSKVHIEQGYLARGRRATIRVRIRDGREATLTIKSREKGMSRDEFEYRIPLKQARALLELCGKSRLAKERYGVPHGGLNWEVDVFLNRADGLVLAEIELEREDQKLKPPKWVGEEVTSDPRYRNSALVDDLAEPAAQPLPSLSPAAAAITATVPRGEVADGGLNPRRRRAP